MKTAGLKVMVVSQINFMQENGSVEMFCYPVL